jgi:hypothetical protein
VCEGVWLWLWLWLLWLWLWLWLLWLWLWLWLWWLWLWWLWLWVGAVRAERAGLKRGHSECLEGMVPRLMRSSAGTRVRKYVVRPLYSPGSE